VERAKTASAEISNTPAAGKRRLSFKEKHALKDLPAQMARLQAEVAALQGELADDALYARDQKRFAAAAMRLTQAQAELAAAEDRWIEIEMLREEIEGPG